MCTYTTCGILLPILSYTIMFYIMSTIALNHKVQYNLNNYLSISLPIISFSILVNFLLLLSFHQALLLFHLGFILHSYRNSAKCVTDPGNLLVVTGCTGISYGAISDTRMYFWIIKSSILSLLISSRRCWVCRCHGCRSEGDISPRELHAIMLDYLLPHFHVKTINLVLE